MAGRPARAAAGGPPTPDIALAQFALAVGVPPAESHHLWLLQPELRLGGRLSLRADRHRAAAALAAALAPLDSELTALLAGILADSRLEEEEEEACNVEGDGSDHLEQRWRSQQQQQSRRTDAGAAAVAPLQPYTAPRGPRPAYPQPAPCAFLRPGQAFEGRQRVAQCGGGNPKQEHWEVHASIQRYDAASGYVCGTMEAANVPEALAPVTTFFEGEIVDNVNHTFYTGACMTAGCVGGKAPHAGSAAQLHAHQCMPAHLPSPAGRPADCVPRLLLLTTSPTCLPGPACLYAADWEACADTDFRHWSKFESFRELHGEVARNAGRCPCESAQWLGGGGAVVAGG